MGFTGVDREVAEKARIFFWLWSLQTSMSVFMLLPVTWFPKPKNQALEENQWITDLAVNNVLDNLVGDDGDD